MVMNDDCFHYPVPPKGFVIIKPSDRDASGYAVWFNETLIGDNFDCADDAVDCASRKDFSRDPAIRRFNIGAAWIPNDLRRWNRGLPDVPQISHEAADSKNASQKCPPRPWRHTDSRR